MPRQIPPHRKHRSNNDVDQKLWWLDPYDARFANSLGAKVAYAFVWALGMVLLLELGRREVYLLTFD